MAMLHRSHYGAQRTQVEELSSLHKSCHSLYFSDFHEKGGGAILMKSALLLYIHILGFSFMYSS